MAIGFDAGTYNLVCCSRKEKKDDKQGEFDYQREINAFLELPLDNKFMFNIMKSNNVPLIEKKDMAYVLGESAVNMAYTISQLELKRPMQHGCVNPKEKSAFEIMSTMIHSLIENSVKSNGEILYYSVTANAINEDTDAEYHQRILDAIFKAYESSTGFKVEAHPINEALALVYAELANKAMTGIGISFGSGMVNICYAMYGNPIFSFSIVNSGDWIDKQAARATGESIAFINKEKMKTDLSKAPTTLVERAIHTQYKLMIEHTVDGIKKGFSDINKTVRTDAPVDIVIAGGTSSPYGFATLFKESIQKVELPIKIGEIIKPSDPLRSVARGCLVAAEAASAS
jgi:hypothetical protein